jgi:hypothetical protein
MSSVTNVASDETIAKDAYARVKADWAALASDQLLQVNLEPYFAAETVLGAWVRLKTFREQMAKLPGVNVALIDKLEDYVLALRYVQGRYVMGTKPPNNFDQLVTEANKLNDILEADARALALRGLFDGEKLARLTGGNSFKGLADDLEALASELEAVFPQIEGKTGITRDDLKAATQMATRLTRLRGEDQLSPEAVAELTEERQRAFTQLIKAYEEARAAIAFLRRAEGDADQIAPNVYIANTRRRRAFDPPVAKPPTTTPGTPPPTGSVPPRGAPAGGTALPGNGAAPSTPTTPSTSSPFMT